MKIAKIFNSYPPRAELMNGLLKTDAQIRERKIWEKVMKEEARRQEILNPKKSSSTIYNTWKNIRKFLYEYFAI